MPKVQDSSNGGFARAHGLARKLLGPELLRVMAKVQESGQDLPGPGGLAARLMTDRPGKMVRPMLVGLLHRAAGGAGGPMSARAAAVVEVVHLSTLLHDDVVDEAPTRRGMPSGPALAGNAAAVLGGDALVVRSLTEANALGPFAVQRSLHALSQLVRGELIQLGNRKNAHVTPETALEVCALKTGALMRLASELGIWTAGGSVDEAVRVGNAFERLGVAFQITDDLLDLGGDASTVGKAVGADVAQGTISHPLALALHLQPELARQLAEGFAKGVDAATLGAIAHQAVARSGAMELASRTVESELAASLDVVGAFPASRARTILLAVCAALGQRAV